MGFTYKTEGYFSASFSWGANEVLRYERIFVGYNNNNKQQQNKKDVVLSWEWGGRGGGGEPEIDK